MKKPLNENVIFERLKKHEGFIYSQSQLSEWIYFEPCYKYVMENCIDVENKQLRNITKVVREQSYQIKNRQKRGWDGSNRGEEWFVLDLFYRNTDRNKIFGELVPNGYQVPIKGTKNDKGIGKIDFISISNGYLYLHEIKADYSVESILKAILEIQTYYQQINHDKLITDYELNVKVIKKSIVIFKNSDAHNQLKDPRVKGLLKLFDIEVFILSNSNIFDRIYD